MNMWTVWGIVVGVAAPCIMGLIEYSFERGAGYITLTPREWVVNPKPQSGARYILSDKLVDFVPRMQQYTKTAEIAITVASASIVFAPSHLSKLRPLAFSLTLLGFTILWGFGFVAWMSYCYEQALYKPENFTARKSSTMFGLGFGALACFAGGYLALAIAIAHAIAIGAALT
jgi:hypothetical protein